MADGGVSDSQAAVIARTGFFVLSSVFKERPSRGSVSARTRLATRAEATVSLFCRALQCGVPVRCAIGPLAVRSATVPDPVAGVKPQFPGPGSAELVGRTSGSSRFTVPFGCLWLPFGAARRSANVPDPVVGVKPQFPASDLAGEPTASTTALLLRYWLVSQPVSSRAEQQLTE